MVADKRKDNRKFSISTPIKKGAKIDIPLNIAVLVLVIFGIIMVYSASMYTAKTQYNNEYFYMQKQVLGAVLGIFATFAMTLLDYKLLEKLQIPLLILSIVLLVLVFVPGIGIENYGAKRWINLPFFSLQASEIAKFAFIVFCASYASKKSQKMTTFKGILPILIVGGIICVLIILEPNMSVTMVVGMLMLCMLFMGGASIKHFLIIGIPALISVPLLIAIEPYRLKRLMAFINPWENPLSEGYQLVQSYYALGSGGFFGVGLFNSRQKYLFLPFSESDFIFSIIGEELGWVGCICVIALFVFIIYRAFKIAKNASDRFGGLVASGIGCLIGLQVLVNIAVVSGSIPPTGIPLPFVSAGSTSLIVFCASIGVLNSIKLRSDPI